MIRLMRFLLVALFALVPALSFAQVTINLPDTSQTTTLSAVVSEQASITMPSSITFNVTNVGGSTVANAAVSVSNIVTATAAKQLRISVQANAANFTPPRRRGDDLGCQRCELDCWKLDECHGVVGNAFQFCVQRSGSGNC